MTDPVDKMKMQQRRDTRRAWWFAGGVVMAVLGVILAMWLRDAGPPDDVAMLPIFTEGGGKDNALLQFVREVAELPDSGYENLSTEARNREWTAMREVADFLAQPQNIKRNEAWQRLITTDMGEWRWRLQDQQLSRQEMGLSYLKQVQSLNNLMALQAVWLAREGKSVEAMRIAVGMCHVGKGLMKAEGSMIHWQVAQTMSTVGWRTVNDVLALDGMDEAGLAEVAREIALFKTNALPALSKVLKVEYARMKHNTERLRQDPSLVHPRLNKLVMPFIFKGNMTVRAYLHYQQPLAEAAEGDVLQFAKALEDFENQLNQWSWRGWGKHIHPNGLGQWMAVIGLATQTRVCERGIVADVPAQLTSLMLAIRRYELRYGRLPANLEELVPQFVESLPREPFDGKPLRWDATTRRLYSVGKDGVDDGGDFTGPVTKEKQMDLRANDFGAFYLWGEEARNSREEEYGPTDGSGKKPQQQDRRRSKKQTSKAD